MNHVQYSWLTSVFWFRSILIALQVEWKKQCEIYSVVGVEIEENGKCTVGLPQYIVCRYVMT